MTAKKFEFERVFDQGGKVVAAPKPPKKYTDDEIEAIRQAAFAEGEQSATAEAAQQTTAACQTLIAKIEAYAAQRDADRSALQDEAVALAYRAARHLARTLIEIMPEKAITGVFRQSLGTLPEMGEVAFHVPEKLYDGLAPQIEKMAAKAGLGERVRLVRDQALQAPDCQITWSGGGAQHTQEVLEAQIAEILGVPPAPQAASGPPADSQKESDAA